jgi:hypothetical protein
MVDDVVEHDYIKRVVVERKGWERMLLQLHPIFSKIIQLFPGFRQHTLTGVYKRQLKTIEINSSEGANNLVYVGLEGFDWPFT